MAVVHTLDLVHGLVQEVHLVVGVVGVLLPSVSFVGIEDRHLWVRLDELLLDLKPLDDELLDAQLARHAPRLVN